MNNPKEKSAVTFLSSKLFLSLGKWKLTPNVTKKEVTLTLLARAAVYTKMALLRQKIFWGAEKFGTLKVLGTTAVDIGKKKQGRCFQPLSLLFHKMTKMTKGDAIRSSLSDFNTHFPHYMKPVHVRTSITLNQIVEVVSRITAAFLCFQNQNHRGNISGRSEKCNHPTRICAYAME